MRNTSAESENARTPSRSGNFESLWGHAVEGNLLAIFPCDDIDIFLEVLKRRIDTKLKCWIGSGFGERGFESFVAVLAKKGNSNQFKSFVRRVQSDLGLSAVIGDGLYLKLFNVVRHDGVTTAVVRQPFGVTSRLTESPSGRFVLNFDESPNLRPTTSEWLELLRQAYADLRGIKSFWFTEILS